MEEKEKTTGSEQQPKEKFWTKISGYVFVFFLGAITGAFVLYWLISPMFIEICNTGSK